MLPQRPSTPQRTVGYDQAPPTVQRTVTNEPPAQARSTVGYEEGAALASDANVQPVRPAPAVRARTMLGYAAPANPALDATLVGAAEPITTGPTSIDEPAQVSGASSEAFAATMLHPDSSSAVTLPDSRVLSTPPSVSQSMRSTVLPRVQLEGGQPKLLVRDRPRYEEQKRLGEGGVGEVVMALDNDIERKVAMKRLLPGMQGTTALARFVEEIRTVGQLEHPGIVPIHDVGLDERGQFYFVMKYVNGDTLEHIIERLSADDPVYHQRYTIERRIEIFISILEAMSYAHDKGYIHRDIKPANIMVGPHGEVVVMDWGLAKQVGQTVDLARETPDEPARSLRLQETRLGTILGTPYYMSPEQARGQHDTLDQRSDIYSLCMLFFELLTLQHPLGDCTDINQVLHAIMTREPPSGEGAIWRMNKTQGAVPAELRHFLRKGLQKDAARRYGSVQEMIMRLRLRAEGCVDIECPVTFWTSVLGKTRRLLERRPVEMASAFIVVTLLSMASMVYSVVHLLRA